MAAPACQRVNPPPSFVATIDKPLVRGPASYASGVEPAGDPAAPVDVVMVTWNTRDLTLDAIGRLGALRDRRPVRLLVHDNASTDGSAAAITAAYPWAEVETGTSNLGFAAAVNRTLGRSRAPWVLLLNSDAWPEPDAVDAMVDCGSRHPRAAAVAPRLLRPDGTLEPSTWPLPSLRTAVSAALRPGRYAWAHDTERQVGWAVFAALLLRRAALDEIGPLDERLFMYGEDLDWGWRAAAAGWQTWFTPEAVVRHVGNASGAQRYGEDRAAAWINNAVRVHRVHAGRVRSAAWRVANAGGAGLSAYRARRQGDSRLATRWRRQARAWLRRPHDDRDGAA